MPLAQRVCTWAVILAGSVASAQTLGNQSLNGKYFFRQVSLGSDTSGNLTDARSLSGIVTFDSTSGHYSYTGQVVVGTGAATAQTGNGAYSVDPAGFVSLDSPLRAGEKVNARFSAEAVVGSSTEPTSTNFDLFVAIPAPATPATTSSLSGSYWVATLDFPGGSFTSARNTLSNWSADGMGNFPAFTVNGHAADSSSGQPSTQPESGATYTVAGDGTITAVFGAGGSLLSGNRTFYLSQDGNILLGGSLDAGVHGILIGVKASTGVTNSSWSGDFWGAGLRKDDTAVTGYSGSAVSGGSGTLIWTRRLKILGFGNLDFTGVNNYSLNADGSGTAELAQVALGAGGAAFLGAAINASDSSGYEIYFGVRMPALSGTGLWINPQGVVSPVSYSPTGNPISPGGFNTVFGTGFPSTLVTAKPPYPLTLNGVTVLVNNQAVPIYATIPASGSTPASVDFLVPYGIQGSTATIAVQMGGQTSNVVTVPVAATAPGVLAVSEYGTGPAVMQHANYVQITATSPAVGGEAIIIYLTGLGAVSPAVADGSGGGANPPSTTVQAPTVLIGGVPATVLFSGLTSYPGLYQINAVMPPVPPGATSLPLAISTGNAYHDQVTIPVNP